MTMVHCVRLAATLCFACMLTLPQTSYSFTVMDKNEIVKIHNNYRMKSGAADMLTMKWDSKLEQLARSYVLQCNWQHNPKREKAGENMFASISEATGILAVRSWYREKQNYNYDMNHCSSSSLCAHYKQIVWANTTKIGCGTQFCPKIQNLPLKKANFVVCNYSPAGNALGRRPFRKGVACSKCPPGHRCVYQLCSTGNSKLFSGVKLGIFVAVVIFELLPGLDSL